MKTGHHKFSADIHSHLRHTRKFYRTIMSWWACRNSASVVTSTSSMNYYVLTAFTYYNSCTVLLKVLDGVSGIYLYLYELWPQQMRRLRMVPRGVFGPKREDVTGGWRKLHNKELVICTFYLILLGWSNRQKWDWLGMYHTWEVKVCTKCWLEYLRHPLRIPGHRWKDSIRVARKEIKVMKVCTGFMWLRIGTKFGLLGQVEFLD